MHTAVLQNIFESLFVSKLHLVFVIQLLHPFIQLFLSRTPHKTVSVLLQLYFLFFFFDLNILSIRVHCILCLEVLNLDVYIVSLVPQVRLFFYFASFVHFLIFSQFDRQFLFVLPQVNFVLLLQFG